MEIKIKPEVPIEQETLQNYLVDEFDTNAVNKLFKPSTIVLSDAGCGKTYASVSYAKSKYKTEEILGVCAWNSQAKNLAGEYKIESITYHNLRGEGLTGKDHKTAYNLGNKKCIIIDEIMLLTHSQLCKIKNFTEEHSDIEFLATGDPNQLDAIGDIITTKRKIKYVRKIFPHIVVLRVNKRIIESDRPKLKLIQADIAAKQMSVEQIVLKYFPHQIIKNLEGLKEKRIFRGVSFFDSSMRTVNKTIHSYFPHNQRMIKKVKTLENGITYHFDSELICKKQMKLVGTNNKDLKVKGKLCPNYMFKILMMNNKEFTLEDKLDKTQYTVHIPLIIQNFTLPYTNTVHAAQGDRIKEKFIIADWKCDFVSLKWLYTAITRCTRFDDVFFLDQNLSHINIHTVINEMIAGYKTQDKKRVGLICKEDLENYVDDPWIIGKYKECEGQCHRCPGNHMTFEKHSEHKVTVNRLNNKLVHTKDNCEVICSVCNKSLRDLLG